MSFLRINSQIQGHGNNLILHDYFRFSSRDFAVLALTCSSLAHFELILVYAVRWGPSSFLCTRLSIYPTTICWKVSSFSTDWSEHPCWKSVDPGCMGFFLDSQSQPTVLCVCPMRSCTALVTYFVISFEMRTCETSNLVLLFQDCFDTWGPLQCHMNFKISLSIWEGTWKLCREFW